jgi:hypothetical protein
LSPELHAIAVAGVGVNTNQEAPPFTEGLLADAVVVVA